MCGAPPLQQPGRGCAPAYPQYKNMYPGGSSLQIASLDGLPPQRYQPPLYDVRSMPHQHQNVMFGSPLQQQLPCINYPVLAQTQQHYQQHGTRGGTAVYPQPLQQQKQKKCNKKTSYKIGGGQDRVCVWTNLGGRYANTRVPGWEMKFKLDQPGNVSGGNKNDLHQEGVTAALSSTDN